MVRDPTEEIKAIRHRMGAEMDFDVDRIIEDAQRRQKESGRTYIRLPKREPRIQKDRTEADGRPQSNGNPVPSTR